MQDRVAKTSRKYVVCEFAAIAPNLIQSFPLMNGDLSGGCTIQHCKGPTLFMFLNIMVNFG